MWGEGASGQVNTAAPAPVPLPSAAAVCSRCLRQVSATLKVGRKHRQMLEKSHLQAQQRRLERQRGAPLVLQNIEADRATGTRHIGVPHARGEAHLGRDKGVLVIKLNVHLWFAVCLLCVL